MTVAEKILIVGGVLNLAYGVLLGYAIVITRVKGAPTTPRYLLAVHLGTLLHAAVLLGLVWAARLSNLSAGLGDAAAGMIVASSALIATKDTVNWLTGVRDEFVDEPKTTPPLAGLGAVTMTTGVGILLVGVLTSL